LIGKVRQNATAHSVFVNLDAGRNYKLKVEFFQSAGRAECHLEWAQGKFRELIPATQFSWPE
jgi:hypothetical protein